MRSLGSARPQFVFLSIAVFWMCALAPGLASAATPGGNGPIVTGVDFHANAVGGRRQAILSNGSTILHNVGAATVGHHNASASWDGKWMVIPHDVSWAPGDTSETSLMRTNGTDHRPLRFLRADGVKVGVGDQTPLAFLKDGTIAVAAITGELTIIDINMNVVRRVQPGYTTPPGANVSGGYSVLGNDGTFYVTRTVGAATHLYSLPLGGDTWALRSSSLPSTLSNDAVHPHDVAADNTSVLFTTSRFGVQEVSLTTGEVRTIAPDTPDVAYLTARYSPDGTRIHVTQSSNGISVVTLDRATGANVWQQDDADAWTTMLVQVPIPNTPEVRITGSHLTGDVIEIDQVRHNPHPFAFTALEDLTGGADGIMFNNRGYSEGYRAGFTPLAGPTPARTPALAPGETQSLQYLVGLTSPGFFQVYSRLWGRSDIGGPFEVTSNFLTVEVAPRTPEERERYYMMTGGYVALAEHQRDMAEAEVIKALALVNRQISKLPGLSKAERAARSKPNAYERSLARRMGLADDALAWLPDDPTQARKMLVAFGKGRLAGRFNAVSKELKTQGGNVKYAGQFWYNQAFGPTSSKVAIMPILMEKPAATLIKYEGWASEAGRISALPDAEEQFWKLTRDAGTKMWADTRGKITAQMYGIQNRRSTIARQLATDNVKGAEAWGRMLGAAEGEGAIQFAKHVLSPDKAKILGAAKRGSTMIDKHRYPELDIDAPGIDMDDLGAGATKGRKPTVEETGMGKKDQATAQRVLREVEDDVFASTGVRVDLAMSFRERNVHSSALGDAAMGKVGLFSTKAGTDLDVLLGMDPKALGKAVYYKPTLPKGLDAFDDMVRHQLIQRHQTMLKEWRGYTKPGSQARKASLKAGVTYQNKGPNGVVTSTLKIKTDEVHGANGTITLRYRELTVDGIKVVKPNKPKWVSSDYDGNAVTLKGGGKLPAGVSSMVQLKLNRKLIEAARDDGFAYGMHGFSFNAIDLTSKPDAKFRQRDVLKFLMESLEKEDRDRMLKQYLSKYGPDDYVDFLASFETGKYVIRITSGGAETAKGL